MKTATSNPAPGNDATQISKSEIDYRMQCLVSGGCPGIPQFVPPVLGVEDVGGKFVEKIIEEVLEDIELSKGAFGHTFTTHGEEMTDFLTKRAAGSGKPQGQFLDNQAAAKFIQNNLGELGNGAVSLPVPEGFPARVIMPDGSYVQPSTIRLVPSGSGVKTAFPEP